MTRTRSRLRGAALALSVTALAGLSATAIADEMPHEATHHAPKGMSVKIRVVADAKKGHNLFVQTKKLRWAPERASGKHRKGEGHAHLYVDGVKITRLYGPAYYLGDLAPGSHVVRVTLNGNDHGDYVRKGKDIAAETTVVVPEPAATPMG